MTATLDTTPYVAAVTACKIYPLLTDPSGGPATYGSGVVIPGITDISVTPKTSQKDLNGDNQLLQSLGFTNSCDVKIQFSEFSFDAWPLFNGGVASTTGADPSQVRQLDWSLQRGGLFKLEATCTAVTAVGGDFHILLPRMNVITPPGINVKFQDFSSFEVSGVAYRLHATGIAASFIYNETAVVLA